MQKRPHCVGANLHQYWCPVSSCDQSSAKGPTTPKHWCDRVWWWKSSVKSEHSTTRNRFESWSTRLLFYQRRKCLFFPKCCLLWFTGGKGWFKLSLLKMFVPGTCTDVTVVWSLKGLTGDTCAPLWPLLWWWEKEDFCRDEPAGDNFLESCSCSMRSLWSSSHLLALVPTTEGSPVLHLLFPQRERFWLHPIPLLERDKMSWWDPRHIKRVRHRGRHQALW